MAIPSKAFFVIRTFAMATPANALFVIRKFVMAVPSNALLVIRTFVIAIPSIALFLSIQSNALFLSAQQKEAAASILHVKEHSIPALTVIPINASTPDRYRRPSSDVWKRYLAPPAPQDRFSWALIPETEVHHVINTQKAKIRDDVPQGVFRREGLHVSWNNCLTSGTINCLASGTTV